MHLDIQRLADLAQTDEAVERELARIHAEQAEEPPRVIEPMLSLKALLYYVSDIRDSAKYKNKANPPPLQRILTQFDVEYRELAGRKWPAGAWSEPVQTLVRSRFRLKCNNCTVNQLVTLVWQGEADEVFHYLNTHVARPQDPRPARRGSAGSDSLERDREFLSISDIDSDDEQLSFPTE